MSRNLVKQMYMVAAEGSRVIDTNELLRRREADASAARETAEPDSDGFVSGLNAQEIEVPPEDGGAAGNVIKANEEIELLLEQAQADAETILEQARREAEDIVAEAKSQAEAEKKNVLEQARQKGYAAGQEKAAAEADVLRNEYHQKTVQLEAEYQQIVNELEPRFVDTITDIYEHIFQVELGSSRDILEYLISNTMHKLEGGRSFLIHVSKEDYSHVNEQKTRILSGTVSENATVDVVEDLTLGKNECLIETENGIFDCGLGTQLGELKRRLTLLAWSREE